MASMLLAAETETATTSTSLPTKKFAEAQADSAAVNDADANDNDDADKQDLINSNWRYCANDANFGIICVFLQKFANDLCIDRPNFKHLQEWLSNTDKVSAELRDLHIKLLRKTRKTVHEKSWESALSKFCFTYSAQDAWELERFGYKKSNLKVKLRILKELLESQFERNMKFRAKIAAMSAETLRMQPIGRDRLGHAYWLIQDEHANLRIYQEHLDEEIWQVVATNREEFVQLIERLKGNEVVLPCADLGIDEDSSNSCTTPLEKPPPPEEQEDDDSQEEQARVPNLRIKLSVDGKTGSVNSSSGSNSRDNSNDAKVEENAAPKVQPLHITQQNKIVAGSQQSSKLQHKRTLDAIDDKQSDANETEEEELNARKKARPTLLNPKRPKKACKYEQERAYEDGEEDSCEDDFEEASDDNDVDDEEEEEEEEEADEEDIDSAAADEGEDEQIEENDDDDDDDVEEQHNIVGEAIEDPPIIVRGRGAGKTCQTGNYAIYATQHNVADEQFLTNFNDIDAELHPIFSEVIIEPMLYIAGQGAGAECMVGNNTNAGEETPVEPKATFFFGEPGCLKLSPIKIKPKEQLQEQQQCEQNDKALPEIAIVNAKEKMKLADLQEQQSEFEVTKAQTEQVETNNDVAATTTKTENVSKQNNSEQSVAVCNETLADKIDSATNAAAETEAKEEKQQEQTEAAEAATETAEKVLTVQTELKANLDDAPLCESNKNENKLEENNKTDAAATKSSADNNEEQQVKAFANVVAEAENNADQQQETIVELEEQTCQKVQQSKNEKLIETVAATQTTTDSNADDTKNVQELTEEIAQVEEPELITTHAAATPTNNTNDIAVEDTIVTETELPLKQESLNSSAIELPQAAAAANVADTSVLISKDSATTVKENQLEKMEPKSTQKLNEEVKMECSDLKCEQLTTTSDKLNEEQKKASKQQENHVVSKEDKNNEQVKTVEEEVSKLAAQPANTKDMQVSVPKVFEIAANSTAANKTQDDSTENTSSTPRTSKASSNDATVTAKEVTIIPTNSSSSTASKLPNRKRRLAQTTIASSSQQQRVSASESDFDVPSSENAEIANLEESADSDIGGKRLKIRGKVTNIELRKKVEALKTARGETSSSGEEDARKQRNLLAARRKEQLATASTAQTSSTKIKPTLEQIIETKLKKTPEQPSCFNVANVITPPKKLPITKPLKKNLLTQLRQEESDEEAIPRKRTISETVLEASKQLMEEDITISKLPAVKEQLERQRTPERQRKRRNSAAADKLEQQTTPTTEHNNCKEGVSEKLKKNDTASQSSNSAVKATHKEKPKKAPTPAVETEIAATPMINRRSSRRVGSEVVHTELPLVKRTRAAGATAAKMQPKSVLLQNTAEVAATPIKAAEESAEKNIKTEDAEELLQQSQQIVEVPKKAVEETENIPFEKILKTQLKVKITSVKLPDKASEDEMPKAKKTATTKSSPQKSTKQAETVKKETAEKSPARVEAVKPTSTNTVTAKSTTSAVNDKKSPANADTNKPVAVAAAAENVANARARAFNSRRREVDTNNIIETNDAETPVRQSRRIAQQKIREEAERRKLEEIALRSMKQELKKKKKAEKEADPTVVPSEASSSSAHDSEDGSSAATEKTRRKRAKKKCPGKDGWSSGSEEQDEPEEEEVFEPRHESDAGSSLFKSDHEFSPESELEDETQQVPMKRARTARKEDADENEMGNEEEACQKCGKSDHPEWILLCDTCDKGYHCSCLSPVLFYIPEGDWHCPPCQQEQLIAGLQVKLQEYDELVERQRLEAEQLQQELAEQAAREQRELEEQQKLRKTQKKSKHDTDNDEDQSSGTHDDDAGNSTVGSNVGGQKQIVGKPGSQQDSDADAAATSSKRLTDRGKRRRNRRLAMRGHRRRKQRHDSDTGSATTHSSRTNGAEKSSGSSTSSSSTATDSDDEPIYKLRKRRQINVSYRLNEFDDLINSALKKEMDEVAGAGNLGRGKDISTILEADKEEKARIKREEEEITGTAAAAETATVDQSIANAEPKKEKNVKTESVDDSDDEDDVPLKPKGTNGNASNGTSNTAQNKQVKTGTLKKKVRKLTTLDISSEEDNASDEDFKTSSFEEDDDEDTSISVSTESDSSLEVYRKRSRGGKKKRKAARRAARERRKDRKFVVDESEDEDDVIAKPSKKKSNRSKKKRADDSDYTESSVDEDELSDLSENVDSADLCNDTTTDDSDGAWMPNKRKKQRKGATVNAVGSGKVPKTAASKKPMQAKKQKRLEYSDDDISESTEEEDDDDYAAGGGCGKGSGKQPRSQPLIPSKSSNNKSKTTTSGSKKKKRSSDEQSSYSDNSQDSTPRTRGRRYAYLEDFDDDSSDGGIKPGVQRPDTPPEERQKFIQKQEEIKRMLAEKNAEGAKLAATPRLTPIKAAGEAKDKRSPAKLQAGVGNDSLSTVPLSVIRQAKVLDIDYLQRKGENVDELDADEVDDDFDDADLPDDLPDDMDEDAIARMVDDDEDDDFAVAATRTLPPADEVLRSNTTPIKAAKEKLAPPIGGTNPSLAAMAQMHTTPTPGLQEPMRKRLPMPTMHPPLLRHQFPATHMNLASTNISHMQQRHSAAAGPSTQLLQNALSAPLRSPMNRNFPSSQLMSARAPLPVAAEMDAADAKPRGRRKKITPLRDTLQKQQAAAAAAAVATAAAHAASTSTSKNAATAVAPTSAASSTSATTGAVGVIKSALSVVQPPQLYKPAGAGENSTEGAQMSVITRMPHLPSQVLASQPPPGAVYAAASNAAPRFYGNPTTASANAAQRARAAALQMPPGMSAVPPTSHAAMRPTYGPPPPLRVTGNQPPLHAVVRGAPPAPFAQAEHLPSYGAPPPARHAAGHLSAYRQPPPAIYGNPQSFMPRPAVGAPPTTMRSGAPEYAARAYAPYGAYYPPPPPLTTPQVPPVTTNPSNAAPTAAPSSVIVAAPPASLIVAKQQLSPAHDVKPPMESNKKLITLEAYSAAGSSSVKSPLHIAGESSGSRSSPGIGNEDSSTAATHGNASGADATAETGVGSGASEFSGLVSYFSSQHDDYNS